MARMRFLRGAFGCPDATPAQNSPAQKRTKSAIPIRRMRILSGTSYQTASNAAGRRGVVPTVAPLSRRDLLARLCAVPLAGQDRATFSANVKVVNLLATVRNHKGEIVRDLVRDDFLLEEDGRPQTIRYFSQENGLPLTLGLLVDTSASQVRLLGAEREASHRFVR